MANIKKIEGKTGVSYKITVTMGRTKTGKQIRHYQTFTPPPGMSERKAQKEAEKLAIKFEEELRMGFQPDNKITFAEYAAYFLKIRRKNGLKRSTCARYEGLLVRINAAIGGMKLVDLRPQHLNLFYQNLQEKGVIRRPETGRAKPRFQQILQRDKISQEKLSRLSGVASSTIRRARNGETIRWEKIQLLANALQCPADELFEAQDCSESRLSPKTVLEHHRLIRTILAWAEREMLVPYNAASKATPPKATRTIVNTFQPEEITAILQALEDEPIKWRTLVHLMIVTGCRRGEIMGLKWEHVDLEQGILCICETLLASDVGVYADTPKTTDSRRYINIPRETVQLLREYHAEQESWREAVGDRWANTGYVFTRDTGEPMHPDSINGWLIVFSERHGLRHINPHAFRHAMASILIYSGTDILSISKRLGHTTTNTTLNFYGHLLQKADAQSAECIANVLLRPDGK